MHEKIIRHKKIKAHVRFRGLSWIEGYGQPKGDSQQSLHLDMVCSSS